MKGEKWGTALCTHVRLGLPLLTAHLSLLTFFLVTLSEIRSALAALGRRPSKALGQNFLHDQNLARAIVAQLGPRPGDHVVEIGPGLGALTEFLAESGATLTLLEKDPALAARLREGFGESSSVEVVEGDALRFDLRGLWARRPVLLVGNLPYNVSSPLIFHFTQSLCPAERCLFLLQREMADRLAAAPGSPDYGLPTVLLQRVWRVRRGRTLPPSVFHPAPQVDSALVELERRPPGEMTPCDPVAFERAARVGFGQRRKQLRKLLAAVFPGLDWEGAAAAAQAAPDARAEDLSVAQWIALTNHLAPLSPAQDAGEMFDVVDEHDRVTGQLARGEVHARGLRHRAAHLFVFNRQGELWLQRRSPWKDTAPGRWGSSAAGHVDAGEGYLGAVVREAHEELGLTLAPFDLTEIARLPPTEENGQEFLHVFRAVHGGPFTLPPAEAEVGAFFSPAQIDAWLQARPDDFSPGFRECWQSHSDSRAIDPHGPKFGNSSD